MLDRASTFAQPEIVELLKTRFVPVAIDQAYQRRQQDTEGEFYRKIAGQSPRSNFEATTQGFYIANFRWRSRSHLLMELTSPMKCLHTAHVVGSKAT